MRGADLPFELLFEVLLRVPAENLVTCILVCKLWFSIIKSHYFIITHMRYLKDIGANDSLLHIREQSLVISDVPFAVVRNISHSFPIRSATDLILGSCNGLICLGVRSSSGWNVILWNPALRKFRVIDELLDPLGAQGNCSSWSNARADYALGWHEINDDLRVVKMYLISNIIRISIYSLNSGTWNPYVMEDVPVTIFTRCHCFTKGAIHWINRVTVAEGWFYHIAAFNLVEESFKEIVLPEEFYKATDSLDSGSVMELRGTLAFVLCWIPKSRWGNNYIDVWLMQDYGVVSSWAKVFTMQMSGMINRPLGFTKSERLICSYIFRRGEMGITASFNLNTSEMDYILGVDVRDFVLNYMQTLLLI